MNKKDARTKLDAVEKGTRDREKEREGGRERESTNERQREAEDERKGMTRGRERKTGGNLSLLAANESASLLVAQPSGQYGRHVHKGA